MQSEYKKFFKTVKQTSVGETPAAIRTTRTNSGRGPGPHPSQKLRTTQAPLAMTKRQRRRKRSSPWLVMVISCIGISLCGYALYEIDTVEEVLTSIEMDFGLMQASFAAEPPQKDAEKLAANDSAGASDKNAKNPEQDPKAAEGAAGETKGETKVTSEVNMTRDHLTSFLKRKQELDAREDELNRLEAELKRQQEELDKKLTEVQKIRGDISKMLEERVTSDGDKVETLVQVYSTMKPGQAAKVFEEMEEDLAIEILAKMKKKSAAEIMNLIRPEKLKIFSEKFAGFKAK